MRFARLAVPKSAYPELVEGLSFLLRGSKEKVSPSTSSGWSGKRARFCTDSETGFTLLEMLVAVSVLSIAALALVRLDAFTLRSTADLTANTTAQIVAGNKAVDLTTDPAAPSIGVATDGVSNGGQTWRVTSRVVATADPSLLRIDISVSGNGGRANLTIIRPAR